MLVMKKTGVVIAESALIKVGKGRLVMVSLTARERSTLEALLTRIDADGRLIELQMPPLLHELSVDGEVLQ